MRALKLNLVSFRRLPALSHHRQNRVDDSIEVRMRAHVEQSFGDFWILKGDPLASTQDAGADQAVVVNGCHELVPRPFTVDTWLEDEASISEIPAVNLNQDSIGDVDG